MIKNKKAKQNRKTQKKNLEQDEGVAQSQFSIRLSGSASVRRGHTNRFEGGESVSTWERLKVMCAWLV